MPEVNELDAADKFVFDQLAAQSGLTALVGTKIFSEIAPREKDGAEVVPPYVVYAFISGVDRLAIGRTRILVRPLYLVRAVTQADSFVTAAAIADQIDLALHNAPPAVPIAGVQVMGADRTQLIRFTEVEDGVRYNHVGGQYRLFVHSL